MSPLEVGEYPFVKLYEAGEYSEDSPRLVEIWDVYCQQWVATDSPGRLMATLNQAERDAIEAHLSGGDE